jgi:hypothetical protein
MLGLGLVAVTATVCPRHVRASEVFPPAIREHLGLEADPACTVCHATDEGEDDTVVRPFGTTMMRLGVHGDSDTRALIAALDVAESNRLDSDFDGVSDVQELRDGTDPNDGVDLPVPQTGCSLKPSAEAPSFASALPAIAALVIVLRSRRRRSSPGVAQLANRTPRGC